MPDISPNEHLLPKEWLTPATHITQLGVVVQIGAYRTDPTHLAHKINELAGDATFYTWSVHEAEVRAVTRSWGALKPTYDAIFAKMTQ